MAGDAENSSGSVKPWQFKPGQSGNPGGRPKGIAAIARAHAGRAVDVLVEAMDDKDSRVRIAAAKEILDRAYGKAPVFTADLTGKLDEMDDDTLDAALAAIGDAIRAASKADGGAGKATTH